MQRNPVKLACPVCGGIRSSVLLAASIERVVEGYRKELDLDIRHLLPSDGQPIQLLRCPDCEVQWFSPLICADDAFYVELQKHDWYYQTEKPEHHHAAKLIPAGSSVLEVGCGSGAFASHLDRSVTYRGLEFNERAVASARDAGLDVRLESIDSAAAKAPASYDVVCHFQVMEHVSDVTAFMRSCMHALKDGGTMIVSVPAADSFLSIAFASWLNIPPHHVTRWSDLALGKLFQRLGVSTSHVWHEDVAPYHKRWYDVTVASWALASMWGGSPTLDGSNPAFRVARQIAKIRGLTKPLVQLGERRFPYSKRGHSVTIWGTKSHAEKTESPAAPRPARAAAGLPQVSPVPNPAT